jgi:hypothetical protein
MNRTLSASVVALTTLTILGLLGALVFASASGASASGAKPHTITSAEDTVSCRPQKDSSDNLWTCTDYYGNQFPNLIIIDADRFRQDTQSSKRKSGLASI